MILLMRVYATKLPDQREICWPGRGSLTFDDWIALSHPNCRAVPLLLLARSHQQHNTAHNGTNANPEWNVDAFGLFDL